MTYRKNKERKSERGSALVYILIAIALLAALTVTFMEPSSQQTSSQSGFRTATAVKSQADLIRSAVQECILRYANGDRTINEGTVTDVGARIEFPLRPDSEHLPASLRADDRSVADIRCPGNNDGVEPENHQLVFGGNTGKFLPAAPELFENWQWYNGTDGVFFWTYTTKSDSFLLSSLEKLDENYAECEADVIDATGGVENLDVAATVSCPSGAVCFRVWMINNASAPHADATAGDTSCGSVM